MTEGFNKLKALSFLERTHQNPLIIRSAYDRQNIDYKLLHENMNADEVYGDFVFISCFDIMRLYCKVMVDYNYDVPFTLDDLKFVIWYMPYLKQQATNRTMHHKAKRSRYFNLKAYNYTRKLNNKLSKQFG